MFVDNLCNDSNLDSVVTMQWQSPLILPGHQTKFVDDVYLRHCVPLDQTYQSDAMTLSQKAINDTMCA